ncbi:MAG TPA: hypothetical protein DET40_20235 [Lentisphaeria bacterium]|nr:MAG: hypothetical protein A2X45_16525 [Lentisphaerae bacterium GWF2_50_93]HCE45881.1 hypothetical protein [Lentisphaeria bacterium]
MIGLLDEWIVANQEDIHKKTFIKSEMPLLELLSQPFPFILILNSNPIIHSSKNPSIRHPMG